MIFIFLNLVKIGLDVVDKRSMFKRIICYNQVQTHTETGLEKLDWKRSPGSLSGELVLVICIY